MHKVLFLLYSVHTPSANTKALYVYSTSDCFGVVSSCCTIVNEKFQWLFSPGKPAPLKRYVPAHKQPVRLHPELTGDGSVLVNSGSIKD